MSRSQINWDEEIPYNPEDEYQAFLRALRRKQGFGLFFVQCSPAEGEKIIQRVQTDLPQKPSAVLKLEESLEKGSFYDRVEAFLQAHGDIKILFIQGLEHSLYDYEETKKRLGWSSDKTHNYSWEGVPRILSHLNQQRERFRDNFPICFVFLVPLFVIKYFIRRAPDFFDWRSGVFQFPVDLQGIEQDLKELVTEGNFADYETMKSGERWHNILYIRELLEDPRLIPSHKAELLSKLGFLFYSEEDYKNSIVSYEKSIDIKPDDYKNWLNRGRALSALECDEDAISSYNKALELKPDDYQSWIGKGVALFYLERYKEALTSFDKGLDFQSEYRKGWHYRGLTLFQLKRYEEALTNFDRALHIQPNSYGSWYYRGIALYKLERYEEAIVSYGNALNIQPDAYYIWTLRGIALAHLERYEEAVENYSKVLENQPANYIALAKRADALMILGRFEEAILDEASAINQGPRSFWRYYYHGYILYYAGQYKQALENFDKGLKILQEEESGWSVSYQNFSIRFSSKPFYAFALGKSLALLKLKSYRRAFVEFKKFLCSPSLYKNMVTFFVSMFKAIMHGDLKLKAIAGFILEEFPRAAFRLFKIK